MLTEPKQNELPAYQDAVEAWVQLPSWTLPTAVNLLLGWLPESMGAECPNRLVKDRIKEMAFSCANISLSTVGILTDDLNKIRVRPIEFLSWAKEMQLPEPPEVLATAMESHLDRNELEISSSLRTLNQAIKSHGYALPEFIEGALRRFAERQIHTHRSRSIAALLWAEDSGITKTEMIRHPLVLQYGCEGKFYAESTIKGWFKGLNPNKSPGRPPNKRMS